MIDDYKVFMADYDLVNQKIDCGDVSDPVGTEYRLAQTLAEVNEAISTGLLKDMSPQEQKSFFSTTVAQMSLTHIHYPEIHQSLLENFYYNLHEDVHHEDFFFRTVGQFDEYLAYDGIKNILPAYQHMLDKLPVNIANKYTAYLQVLDRLEKNPYDREKFLTSLTDDLASINDRKSNDFEWHTNTLERQKPPSFSVQQHRKNQFFDRVLNEAAQVKDISILSDLYHQIMVYQGPENMQSQIAAQRLIDLDTKQRGSVLKEDYLKNAQCVLALAENRLTNALGPRKTNEFTINMGRYALKAFTPGHPDINDLCLN